MATTTQEHPVGVFGHERRFFNELSAGFGSEALVGAATVILAIVGLAGIEVFYMAAIATIAVGAAFLLEGAVWMAKNAEMASGYSTVHADGAAGGLSAEFLAGGTGIILGILALVGVVPMILLSVALLTYGACMLLGANMASHMRNYGFEPAAEPSTLGGAVHEATFAATGAEALVALAAVVLGILALVHFAPLTLILAGMLVLGGSVLLNGSTMTTWMTTAAWRRFGR
jgi:hypothetical protein